MGLYVSQKRDNTTKMNQYKFCHQLHLEADILLKLFETEVFGKNGSTVCFLLRKRKQLFENAVKLYFLNLC